MTDEPFTDRPETSPEFLFLADACDRYKDRRISPEQSAQLEVVGVTCYYSPGYFGTLFAPEDSDVSTMDRLADVYSSCQIVGDSEVAQSAYEQLVQTIGESSTLNLLQNSLGDYAKREKRIMNEASRQRLDLLRVASKTLLLRQRVLQQDAQLEHTAARALPWSFQLLVQTMLRQI